MEVAGFGIDVMLVAPGAITSQSQRARRAHRFRSRASGYCLYSFKGLALESARKCRFWAPLRMSKLVVPHMAQQRSGLIVNIGSIVGASAQIPVQGVGILPVQFQGISARVRAEVPLGESSPDAPPWTGICEPSEPAAPC
jgi:short-subunit dehydrogenase